MNKILTLAFLFVFGIGASLAQETVGGPQSEYGMLTNKLKKSEASLSVEKKTASAKFWFSRAELMLDIWNVHKQHVSVGANQMNLSLIMGKADEVQTITLPSGAVQEKHIYERITITYQNGAVQSYEETNKIHEDPLPEALKALKKAEELDVDGKLDKKIKEDYDLLKNYLDRDAIDLYSVKNFDGALNNFKMMLQINESSLYEGAIDTIVYYNAGMAASRAGKTDDAIKYYNLAIDNNYPEANVYVFLKNKYLEVGDTTKGFETLEAGFKKYPEATELIFELINYYLAIDKPEEALEYIDLAKQTEPDNVNLVFMEGYLYDKLGERDKAVEAYKNSVAIDDNYYNGHFNLGVIFYNNALNEIKECETIMDQKKYDDCKVLADKTLMESIPYMERANEIATASNNPTQLKETLETLKTIYYRLKNSDEAIKAKYEDVVKKLDTL